MQYPFKKFKLYRLGIGSNNINSIYADAENIYMGNDGYGLDIFSRKSGFKQRITLHNKLPSIINAVTALFPLGKNKLLMLSPNSVSGGHTVPYILDEHTQKLHPLNSQVQKVYADCWGQGNFRHFIFRDSANTLLTNVGEYLVALQQDKNGQFNARPVHHFAGGEMLSCWFKDKDKNLWIGTYKGAFKCTNGTWKKVALPQQTEVKTFNQDNAGNMWLGTNFGIYVLNNKLQTIKYYTEKNYLVNEHLYGILKDDDGNMWFSTNKGIMVYYFDKKIFKHFSVDDGLQSDEFNASAYFKGTDGELFFGGVNGTTSFFPREILTNTHNPQVNITNILLFDKPYKTNDSYPGIRSLTFPYDDNSLSFEFSLPEYTNAAKNVYAYTMQGVDKQWINSGNKRFARYAGLDPGHYVFRAKAANNDSVWGAPTYINIEIVPPFWQRGWFIFLMVIVAVSIVTLAVLLIQKAAYKKKIRAFEIQQRIQSERERISRDLHDNIGTQLSLINKSIKEVTHPSITDGERNKKLDSVSRGSSEVIDVLRETIWALNKPEITLEEFADNLKKFVQKRLELYSDITMQFVEQDANESVILGSSEVLNLFRICQEAVTNTIKYASASVLTITMQSVNGKYNISIADNGMGFKQEPAGKNGKPQYGLENMKYRANEILCELTVNSAPGEGTTIIIIKK